MNAGLMRFLREISSFAKKQTFLFVGGESYFKRKGVQKLRQHWTEQGLMDGVDILEGKQDKTAVVEDILAEQNLMYDNQLVVVYDVDKVKNWQRLAGYIADPDPGVKTIFTSSDEHPRELEDLSFDLKIVCKEMKPGSREFDRYLDYCLETHGKTLDAAAKEHLGTVFANNPTYIEGELEKAAWFVGSENVITKEHLEQTLAIYPVAQVFDIVEAITCRQLTRALQLTFSLFTQGTEGKFLTYLITKRIRTLHECIRAQKNGERLKDFMIRRKIPLFQVDQIVLGLKHLKEHHVYRWYDELAFAEARMSRGDQQRVFENLVVTLCH